jgi:hypothetical protein
LLTLPIAAEKRNLVERINEQIDFSEFFLKRMK